MYIICTELLLTIYDLRTIGMGVTHLMMAISAMVPVQLANHT